jgi:hypothetical protein
MSEEERREALSHYQRDHPLYGRTILWMLARLHRVSGNRVAALAREMPMLSVRLLPKDAPPRLGPAERAQTR